MRFLHVAYRWLVAFGIDPVGTFYTFLGSLRTLPSFLREYRELVRQNKSHPFSIEIELNYPCFRDRYLPGGDAVGGYFYQDLFVARRVFEGKPERHVDVASRVDGFVAHVAAFREIEVFDIRPIQTQAPNIIFRQCDFMNASHGFENYADSLSCLHALEHFGLGRYGDPVNIQGHADGFNALAKVLRPGGTMYLSVPIGRQRIEFNGHRVFSIETILKLAEKEFELLHFSYIAPSGETFPHVSIQSCNLAALPPDAYALGIFEFKKKQVKP